MAIILTNLIIYFSLLFSFLSLLFSHEAPEPAADVRA